jgi:cytoskeleton protein RodZ
MAKEEPQSDHQDEEMEPQEEPGIGDILKAEREKIGLSHDQVAQITKLRRHYVEALENEEWDNLPAPVFVKGFIRSYAQALGLDETKIFDLYKKIGPVGEAPPTPLVEPKKSKNRRVVIMILLLVAAAALISLWIGYSDRTPSSQDSEIPLGTQKQTTKNEQPAAHRSTERESVKEQKVASTNTDKPSDLKEKDKVEKAPSPQNESLPAQSTIEPTLATDWLVLKGVVKSKTWMRIYIDDQEPKEYIFEPGSMLQWKAREGFDILIGNAAGIEFDFNGDTITDLGALGQVVRLRLPEDFEARIAEE